MNRCLLCNNNNLKSIKVINNTKILECTNCNLAITENKKKSDIHELYQSSDLYKIDAYKKINKQQLNKFQTVINAINLKVKKGKFLEVGAGFGLLSSYLSKNKSYKITALEPNLQLDYVKDNKKIKTIKLTYEKYLLNPKDKYNVLLFIDVLEHFPNPSDIINRSKKLLEKDGLVVINLPNYKSIMAKLVQNWSWWMIEDHYFHFSKKSVVKLLLHHNFEVEYLYSYESFTDFKKNLDGSFSRISNSFSRKIIKSLFFMFFLPLYFTFRKVAWKTGFGGLLLVVARYKNEE